MNREVNPDRHRVRLLEDPEYNAQWGTNGKLSVVLPVYSIRPAICKMEIENSKIWKREVDELIVTEDGPYCQELHELADLYLLHPRLGACNNMIVGWQVALSRGADYVVLVDSDVTLINGHLRDMCVPGRVTIPKTIVPSSVPGLIAPMVCIPKTVVLERGMYDKRFFMDGHDTEYQTRISDLIESVDITISHIQGGTRMGRMVEE